VDTTALTESEYSLIRSFLERWGSLVAAARERLVTDLTATIRRKVPGAWAAGDEALLEAMSASYRARYRPSEPVPPAPPPA
jgi:hypothetical protein